MSAKPLIVILCLEQHSAFDHFNATLEALAQKAVVRKASTLAQARRYLTSTVRPHAIIVAEAAVADPEYYEVLVRLVEYARAGGTVVYSGVFSLLVFYSDLAAMFTNAWGLSWGVPSTTIVSGTHTLNPRVRGLKTEGLVQQCSLSVKFVENVALEDAVYLTHDVADDRKEDSQSSNTTCKTFAAFTKIGYGRMGYIASASEGPTTNLLLAMCFWPGSRPSIAEGDGIPEVIHAGHSIARGVTPRASTNTADQPKRNILIISLEKDGVADEIHAQFHQALRKNATVTEVQQPRAALAKLSATPRPDAIVLSDPALARPTHNKLLTRLVAYARSGGTVVAGLQFGYTIEYAQVRPFFARWGVPWDRGSFLRTTTALNPAGVPAPLAEGALLPAVSAKAQHVKNAPRAHAVYLPTAASRIETPAPAHAHAPGPLTGALAQESAAVFARVGKGYLGYVGDVNAEQGSTRLILEMCGVKIRPGDLGAREVTTEVTIHPDGRTEVTTETEEEVPLPAPAPLRARGLGPRPRDAEVAVRAEARRKVREEKRGRADGLKNEGNDLFRENEWEEAAEKYRAAALLGGPQPVYLANLAACLLKLEMWELADNAATRALVHDPRHVKALYRRAHARRELGRLNAALADLEWLLAIDKTNAPALKEKVAVREILKRAGSTDWPEDHLVRSKRDEDVAVEVEDESDSEDFAHPGTVIACRYYNTRETGCRFGKACLSRHAPDSKSIRDELGRNVCLSWLMGHCRFAAGAKCVYAHDATYLPDRGWWTDTARVERTRTEFFKAIKEEPLDLGAGRVEERILAEAFVPLSWRQDMWAVASYKEEVYDRELGSDEDSEHSYGYGSGSSYDYSDSEDSEDDLEEVRGLGELTDADMEEMGEYGIKPWEDGAYVRVLTVFWR
ncbi:transporter [Ganoderma sinense ZZ0214-1]|uniref:Transporter n=1 Tax=Ganoderma sinense ZZ0214-1 TaxID=1077348 RepID=A0A2G8SFI4_9APHY|nr:transporter [Ganoderma sinense ZZ0214-1]